MMFTRGHYYSGVRFLRPFSSNSIQLARQRRFCFNFCMKFDEKQKLKQKAQLSQRDRAMLSVIEYSAKPIDVNWNILSYPAPFSCPCFAQNVNI